MAEIQIPNLFDPPKICVNCIVCGEVAREEYFTGNIDIVVCDKCKSAIAWAKEQMQQAPDKVDWKKELVDDFEKHLHGNTDGILYHHYCIKCGWDWWSDEAFPNRCSKCGCELT